MESKNVDTKENPLFCYHYSVTIGNACDAIIREGVIFAKTSTDAVDILRKNYTDCFNDNSVLEVSLKYVGTVMPGSIYSV
jgi:hypothetical protein